MSVSVDMLMDHFYMTVSRNAIYDSRMAGRADVPGDCSISYSLYEFAGGELKNISGKPIFVSCDFATVNIIACRLGSGFGKCIHSKRGAFTVSDLFAHVVQGKF